MTDKDPGLYMAGVQIDHGVIKFFGSSRDPAVKKMFDTHLRPETSVSTATVMYVATPRRLTRVDAAAWLTTLPAFNQNPEILAFLRGIAGTGSDAARADAELSRTLAARMAGTTEPSPVLPSPAETTKPAEIAKPAATTARADAKTPGVVGVTARREPARA